MKTRVSNHLNIISRHKIKQDYKISKSHALVELMAIVFV